MQTSVTEDTVEPCNITYDSYKILFQTFEIQVGIYLG
jgi:hypothetical protein